MGITTQYLRYVPGNIFGLVGTSKSVRFITRFSQRNKFAVAAACEQVIVWDLKKGSKLFTLTSEAKGNVSAIEVKPANIGTLDNSHIAAGYTDGSVVVFDLYTSQPLLLSGHKSAISCLCWNDVGLLASGSVDGEIVIWDVSSERGVVRFRGHKGIITRVHFLKSQNVIVSSSKDYLIKFWDLDTNHCFRTLAEHSKEVWDFVVLKNDTLLVTGSTDEYLRVWEMTFAKEGIVKKENPNEPSDILPSKLMRIKDDKIIPEQEEETIANDASILQLRSLGYIERTKNNRVSGLKTDGRILSCYSRGNLVESFRILTEEESQHHLAKRLKKERKRAREEGNSESETNTALGLGDCIRKLPPLNCKLKIDCIDLMLMDDENLNVLTLHNNNSIALYELNLSGKSDMTKMTPRMALEGPGHRSEIRAVAFNSIGDQLITGSSESIKIWDRSKNQSVMTIKSDYVVSLIVVPGDRHVVVGTINGHIQLYDIGSGVMLEDIEAHSADKTNTDMAIWGLSLTSDGRGFVSGGSDSIVHFWKFELVEDQETKVRRLSFIQDSRALKVADQVTALKCSGGGKFLIVATLDLKETIYFMDTLKLNNELYGKSLPATCLDFTVDENLVVVGSKDTCLRIFGTDFGDQRRLIKNAHQGGVMAVQFIANTHLFFSSGYDGTVKQWDADNFQNIITLKGHNGIVRCLAVDPKGTWAASCGQDYSIRLWERTQEPLILEEEREEERRRLEEEAGGTATQRPVVEGEDNQEGAVRPTLSTHLTDKAADRLIEALDIYDEHSKVKPGKTPPPNQLMNLVYQTKDHNRFLVEVMRRIKATELEEAILLLPFDYILKLLKGCNNLLQKKYDVELVGRVVIVALRVNLPQLLASVKASTILRELNEALPKAAQDVQDVTGYNLAGLNHMKTLTEQRSEVQLFAEASEKVKDKRKKKKKKLNAQKRAALLIV